MGLNRTVAAVFGVVYVLVGIVGFILTTDDKIFGLFEVNALHNIVHIVLGLALLYGSTNTAAATMMNRWVGIVLLVLGVLGIFSPSGFGLVPIGGADIFLHLASGVILVGTSLMSSREASTV